MCDYLVERFKVTMAISNREDFRSSILVVECPSHAVADIGYALETELDDGLQAPGDTVSFVIEKVLMTGREIGEMEDAPEFEAFDA